MQRLKLYYPLLLLSLLIACKKDAKVYTVATIPTIDSLELLSDTTSFTIAGKTFKLNNTGSVETGNAVANLKIDSFINSDNYRISGDTDSVFFFRSYTLSNAANTSSIVVSFFKKYDKKNMDSQDIYYPADPLDLFESQEYPFAVDFMRQNSHNGVAIAVYGAAGQSYKSYADLPVGIPTTITQADENTASLDILPLKKMQNGEYLLEAKFNAVIFTAYYEKPVKLENGYLRLHLSL